MRTRFDLQLSALNDEMISMGMLCETAIAKAARALLNCDSGLAGELPALQEEIDEMERRIEGICMQLLLRQQPVAGDLRIVSAALKMVTDVERIGDQSADFAEIVALGNVRSIPDTLPLREMSSAVIRMVTESINAFVKQDGKIAQGVVEYDDVVDDLFNECKNAVIALIREPDANGEALVDLLMISKYLERIGDHAVNIACWVLFAITGAIGTAGKPGALPETPHKSER